MQYPYEIKLSNKHLQYGKKTQSTFLKTQMRNEGNKESNQKLNKTKKEKEEKLILTARHPKKILD